MRLAPLVFVSGESSLLLSPRPVRGRGGRGVRAMLESLNEVLGPVKRWRIGGSVSRVARARRWWTTLLALVLTGLSVAGAVPPAEAQLFGSATPFEDNGPAPEFRGLWVDAYRDGFKTP